MSRFVRHRGFSLIEILAVLVVIAILSAVTYSAYLGRSGKAGEKSHGPIAESQSAVCMENLHQVRLAIDMARQGDTEAKSPASLDELKLPHEILVCPDGKEPYQYDPTTGQVHCVHPGHENF